MSVEVLPPQLIGFDDPDGTYALNITILHPRKLTFRILMDMVILFRKKTGRFPDLIEFTPALMTTFEESMLPDHDGGDRFLDIPCIIDPNYLMSHNLSEQWGIA